jgi:hypothetical protein
MIGKIGLTLCTFSDSSIIAGEVIAKADVERLQGLNCCPVLELTRLSQ